MLGTTGQWSLWKNAPNKIGQEENGLQGKESPKYIEKSRRYKFLLELLPFCAKASEVSAKNMYLYKRCC